MHTTPAPPCPKTDVVVAGEAIIDIIDTAEGPVEFPGGSGMDVAFGVGRLGISTALLTALGRDERSKSIRRHLESAGVRLLPGAEHLNRTSTARALLDASGSAGYEFDLEWDLPQVSPTFLPKVLHTGSEEPAGEFGYGRLTRLGTSASLAAAPTVGRHGANPPTRRELIASLELTHCTKDAND
jgi:pfkB family carbohydrate kinase